MPRTFSLARLVIGVTAVCMFLGLVVNFPILVLFVVYLIPTALVWLLFVRVSRHKIAATILVVLGACLAFIPPDMHVHFLRHARSLDPISPAISAFLVCGSMLGVKHLLET